MKALRIISRMLIGLVFVFSGFVKGIDPLGSTHKFADYFRAFGMEWAEPAAFLLGIILSTAEFTIGISLLFGFKTRLGILGAIIFMAFFTPLTLYLAISNPVSDCGCFGDAIKLTNWQTFYKNIIIWIPLAFIIWQRKKFSTGFKNFTQFSLIITMALLMVSISVYCYQHLPIIDFMPYKVGNHLPDLMVVPAGVPVDEYMYDYTLENSKTKATREMTSKEYSDSKIWEDTTWVVVKTSDPILVKEGYHPPIHDFSITSADGQDITDSILNCNTFTFLLVAYNINKASLDNIDKINKLAAYCQKKGYPFIGMSASLADDVQAFKTKTNALYDFCITDETTLKTMIRANPGLMLLKQGYVFGKWHSNDIPSPEEFEKEFH
jgi:uncharacterized membrane protein YphA (DoxX/SURF4 family)